MPQSINEITSPGISFSLNRGEISIFHSTIMALGCPCFIRFLFNEEKGRLAIQKCDKQITESFVVPNDGPEDWDFRIYSELLLKILWKNCGWDCNKTYRCFGRLYQDFELVEFDLQNAEIVTELETDKI